MNKPTLGVIVGSRNYFSDNLVAEGRKQILAVLDDFGVRTVCPDENATPFGAVETWQDAKASAALFKEERDNIDGILITLPNFGDEKGVADAIRLANLDVPILVHAFPDDTTRLTADKRRDAFCGKISVCNNLYHYGYPFSLTGLHTLAPEGESFRQEIDRFLGVCRVVKGMRTARLGAIGARPDAFKTVRYSEKLLESCGMSVSTLDLSEVIGAAEKLDDHDLRVRRQIEEVREYAAVANVPLDSLTRISKLGIVLSDWIEANEIDATALQCWASIQQNYGVNVCILMSMMSEKLMPSACEVDIAGTVSMYALQLASGTPSGLVDWNNNYNDEPNKCLYFHCGNWAQSLVSDTTIISAEVLGKTLGAENTWGALDGRAQAGPFTFARIDTDDRYGLIRSYIGQGQITEDPISTMSGNHAVVDVPDLQELLRFICLNGFAHHCAITASHVADILIEAFEAYLGWDVYRHPDGVAAF